MLPVKRDLKDIIISIANQKKFRPEMIEKDYYGHIILNHIHLILGGRTFYLRGTTAISKAYLGQYRLSNDLDFAIYTKDKSPASRAFRLQTVACIRENIKAFLKAAQLKSSDPFGKFFNNETNFSFYVQYPSFLKDGDGDIKVEISLNQVPLEEPEYRTIRHPYQDLLTGIDLISQGRMHVLSFDEQVAEKLRCVVVRKDAHVRDFYDIGHIAGTGYDFYQDKFIKLFKSKIMEFLYRRNYQQNFGLSQGQLDQLNKSKEAYLLPYIPVDQEFSLENVCEKFNRILSDKRFELGFKDYYRPLMAKGFEIAMERLMEGRSYDCR